MLEPVELYTEYAMVIGQVDPDGRRLSDILNTSSHLSLRDARSISMVDGVEGEEGHGWTRCAIDEILLAMPPEHVSPRQLRVNKRQRRVRVRTGPYTVLGTAHALPGVPLDHYTLRSRMRFLALTSALVSSTTDPLWERKAAVVLASVRAMTDLSEVLTIS